MSIKSASVRSNVHFCIYGIDAKGQEFHMGNITVWKGRAAADSKLNGSYPSGTKTHEQLKKAARWLSKETAAVDATMDAKFSTIRIGRLRVPQGTESIKHF